MAFDLYESILNIVNRTPSLKRIRSAYIRLAGIENDGATETLKILPEMELATKVVSMFIGNTVQQPAN